MGGPPLIQRRIHVLAQISPFQNGPHHGHILLDLSEAPYSAGGKARPLIYGRGLSNMSYPSAAGSLVMEPRD